MAFDAHLEDFQRMGLRFEHELGSGSPFQAARAAASFGRRFAQDHESLPQTDADRAFHLVAQATDLIDYKLPFVGPVEGARLVTDARRMLDEALALDPMCHDARRMIAAQDLGTFDDFYRFLVDGEKNVREQCEHARELAAQEGSTPESSKLAADIAYRPYLRWLATTANRALICGRYMRAIEFSMQLAAVDEQGMGDSDLTLAFAFAKLEEAPGMEALVARHDNNPLANAWLALASLALAYKRHDMQAARSIVGALLMTYPNAGLTLERQDELPDGVFARLVVEPRSEDELILAMSEATVLFQEGRDVEGRGSLGSWVARDPRVRKAAQAAAATEEADGHRRPAGGGFAGPSGAPDSPDGPSSPKPPNSPNPPEGGDR